MRSVLSIFIVCMIGKDLAFAPFPYALRGIAQVLCLITGIVAIIPYLSLRLARRYWPVWGYLATLLVAASLSRFPLFNLLQIASLFSAIVFFIAYFERQRSRGTPSLKFLAQATVTTYAVACLLGLLMIKLLPEVAYGAMRAGTWAGEEFRFRGLFSKAGMMGAAAGLLLGFAAISLRRLPIKLAVMFVAGVCLALTQSRSFWIAAAVAGVATLWRYYPRLRPLMWVTVSSAALVGALLIAVGVRIDTDGAARFARLDTVSTLTGRAQLWDDAMAGVREHPWFGYGFTLGAIGLQSNKSILAGTTADIDPTSLSRQTLHNGYVQCALDAGAVGLFFYAVTMALSLARLLKHDRARQYPIAFYGLIFLMVSNGGESVIYSGSIFQSLCFWALALFCLSLTPVSRAAVKAIHSTAAQHVVLAPQAT